MKRGERRRETARDGAGRRERRRAATRPELAPLYHPSKFEATIYARWIKAGIFQPPARGKPYVIVIPPPNVTGVLHMGHGLNNTIQDVFIRFQRMRGRAVLWLPGTDHAGIATQNVIERLIAKEGKTRDDLGREAFVKRVWAFVKETGGIILDQLKAIGASCDWSRTRFTLDPKYSAAVRHVFVSLWEDGLVYRGHRVIHWCPRCLTSLSDEEAEFHETDGKLYYIRYPLTAGTAELTAGTTAVSAVPAVPAVVVATTRPETMLGDTAVAVHPDAKKTAWALGKRVRLPLTEIEVPMIADEAVDPEFGSGFVKVTPAHDAADFEIGRRHNLAMPLVMDPEARMQDPGDPAGRRVPAELQGRDRYVARDWIVQRLEDQGLLEKIEPHHHAIRRCYRCDTIVEPRLSDQWFVRMEPLAKPVLQQYRAGRLAFVPERWGGVYENWLTEIRDWNISRQLWWGHRIPVFTCAACGEQWADRKDPRKCRKCGAGPVTQDPDVLDTWFSSWLWPFATLGWPEKTPDLKRFYPGHTLVTDPNIIFFWVARMVMSGYRFLGERPFETVVIHGTVRDMQNRRMSKSLGNGIDPLEVARRFGADALRFTLVAGAPIGNDLRMDPSDLEATFATGRNFANKLWNAGRLILSALPRTPPPLSRVKRQLELADRWILSRAQQSVMTVTDALERSRLSDAANGAYHFVWDELADWYLEQVKPRLYGTMPGGAAARSVLLAVFETALRLMHPVMPFLTEELWRHLPGKREPILAAARWPKPNQRLIDRDAEDRFARVQALVTAVRIVRAEYGVPPSRTVRAYVQPASAITQEAFRAEQKTIERLAKIASLTLDGAAGDGEGRRGTAGAHAVLPDGSSVFVPLGDAIDVSQECARLRKEQERLDRQLEGVGAKLANQQFTSRAPVDVVAREREKARSWQDQRDALAGKLRALGCN